jgi:oxygen-independent coproporphyrinogen-3 oxidase
LDSWKQSIKAALALELEHLSLYCLTIEPGTPLYRQSIAGQFADPDPDLAADQYELAGEMLNQAGFDHYEISNWALPGKQCQHNLVYWRNQEYLGFGAGAHGHAAGYRYWSVKQPRVYIRRIISGDGGSYPWSPALANKQQLTERQSMSDTVITQLRLLNEGLDLSAFAGRFGQTLYEAYPGVVERLTKWGLLEQRDQQLLLTEHGRFLSNQVFYPFV